MKPDETPRTPEPEAKAVRLHRARVEDLDVVCDLVDSQLRGDAYMPRSQVAQVLRRHSTAVWLIVFEEQLVGVAITYEKTMLYNIVVAPWARSRGVATSVLNQLKVRAVRCKTNMKGGDPTPFYEANGFHVHERDEASPHIAVMRRDLDDSPSSIESTGEGTDMVLSLLRTLLSGGKATSKKLVRTVDQVKPDSAVLSPIDHEIPLEGDSQKMTVEIPLEQWEAVRLDAQKYRERAQKQRGYQSKRYAKKQKLRGSPPIRTAPEVNVKTD